MKINCFCIIDGQPPKIVFGISTKNSEHRNMAGDKTAYLVTDLTVTAMTVMILNSGFLAQNPDFPFFCTFFKEYTVTVTVIN